MSIKITGELNRRFDKVFSHVLGLTQMEYKDFPISRINGQNFGDDPNSDDIFVLKYLVGNHNVTLLMRVDSSILFKQPIDYVSLESKLYDHVLSQLINSPKKLVVTIGNDYVSRRINTGIQIGNIYFVVNQLASKLNRWGQAPFDALLQQSKFVGDHDKFVADLYDVKKDVLNEKFREVIKLCSLNRNVHNVISQHTKLTSTELNMQAMNSLHRIMGNRLETKFMLNLLELQLDVCGYNGANLLNHFLPEPFMSASNLTEISDDKYKTVMTTIFDLFLYSNPDVCRSIWKEVAYQCK